MTRAQVDDISRATRTAEEATLMLRALCEYGIITRAERLTFLCRLYGRTREAFAEAGDTSTAMEIDDCLKRMLELRDSLNDMANGTD